ncbi:MAG: tetratricopeptide repeat protein [Myxococcota bacterium]|jgi:tetratricopeptide (TPR) repeat protein|nr:tetratricopeptide repeat protein [Myxococcota bacterium]
MKRVLGIVTVIGMLILSASGVFAQDDLGGKQETKLGNVERKKVERKTLEAEEGKGPRVEREAEQGENLPKDKLDAQLKAIKLIEKRIAGADEDDADYPELLERQAEMQWQVARYYDMAAFDALQASRDAADRGDAAAEKKELENKAAAEKEARSWREEAVKQYEAIVKKHKRYKNIDKVLFYLAFNLMEMGRGADANQYYARLVREYPKTPFKPEAYVGLAEYTFNIEEDMETALEQYQQAVDSAPDTPTASFAMYKMGWCYFNLGEPKKAMAMFEEVVRISEKQQGRIQMRKEAIKDLVKAYSMWPEAKESKAKEYFKKFAGDETELREMLERLARLYGESGEIEKSMSLYTSLIKEYKHRFEIVGYQIEIMLNIETLNDPQRTAEEVIRAVQLFKHAKEKDLEGRTPELEKAYYNLLEEHTRETAKWYHMTAQTTKNTLYYALSYELYRVYIENFPEAQDNYDMMFYYAELLYWKSNFADAAKRYDQVLAINETGEHTKSAAHGAVLSYAELARTPSDACPAIPDPPPTKPGEEPSFPPMEIPDCRSRMVDACDRYTRLVSESENLVDIMYTAARIYYDYNQFDKAIPRFHDIAVKHSDHKLGMISANLMLDSLYITQDFKGMWQAVQDFKVTSLNRPPFSEKLAEFEEGLSFKFCNEKEESRDWVLAATCFEDFAAAFPNSVYAPRALWNASVAWENHSEIGKAIETRINLLKSYSSDEDLAPRALYAIGGNFHGIAVYSEAAQFYEMFVEKYPNNRTACVAIDQSSDVPCAMYALQNAAAFRSGLGQYEQAVKNFDLYIKMFPKDKTQISKLMFNTGRIYFDQKLYDKAIERYNDYIKAYGKSGSPGRLVAAHTAIGRAYWRSNRRGAALKEFEKAEEIYRSKGTQKWMESADEADKKEAVEGAAEARFMRGEYIFGQALAVQLFDESVPDKKMEAHLQKQLKNKAAFMQEATPIYVEVIKFGSPWWGLAALCRLGMMYHDIANQIQFAPVPKRLSEEQALIYEIMLLDFADQFEQQAITYYITAVDKAVELGWFTPYTMLAQKRLFDLRPEEYRSSTEIKAQPTKTSVIWHGTDIYDDVEEAAGRKAKKSRGKIELEDSDVNKLKGEAEAAAEGAGAK